MGCICSKELWAYKPSDHDHVSSKLVASGESTSFLDLDIREDHQLLPICETVSGIQVTNSNTSLTLSNEQCVSYGTKEGVMLRAAALGASEKQIWVGFEEKPRSEQDSSVVEELKETRFVTGADGDLHKHKHLFDPCDELLTSVFSGDVHMFPGERFISDEWLNMLRKTGLQNTMDANVVLECARRVEFLGAESLKHAGLVDNDSRDFSKTTIEVSAEIWSLAETLINTVLERFAFLYSYNFCSIFGKIACIPAEFGFPFENRKNGVKRVLCSYNEAVLSKDWPLAWTIAPILTTESLVPPEYSWGALQLRSPPPFTKVLKHLKVEVWCSDSVYLFSEEASYEVLSYLDTIWEALSSSDISELQDVSFIPVCNTTQFMNCSSLFYHLKIHIRPLAFELPLRYLPFVRILKELGLYETLSISSAMMLLSILQNSCRHHRLGPNELRAVIEILHFLYNEITDRPNPDRSDWESLLVVPDDSCRLAQPNSCVYIDAYGSWYVKHIDTSKLRFVHHDVSERLCLTFGIRKLSDVVVEELDYAAHFQTLDGIWSIALVAIRLKLLNRSFQVAVSSVLNSVFSSTSGSNPPDFQSVQRSLESVAQRLQFVQCIYTRFWLLPKSLDITCPSKKILISERGSRSSHCALYYVDRSKSCMLTSEPPSYVSILDLVSLVVSQVLGSPVPLPTGLLFLCPQDSETASLRSCILRLSFDEREDHRLLPICETVGGIQDTNSNASLKLSNEKCLSYGTKLKEKQIWVTFEEKPLSEQVEMLQYLYANWQDLQQDSSVVEALKDTKFVTGADGDLHKPKHLFDPADELLTSVFSGEVHKFPGEKFVSDGGWLDILRKTGLQNTMDADIVLECARRVEFLGSESMKHDAGLVASDNRDFSETTNEVSAQVWSLAETLINAVFERFDHLYSHNFCSIFGKIACIPVEFGFPFESGKKGVKRVLCSYSEAALLKDWPLAWTITPFLTRESLVPPEYSWGALQLTSPPPFTKVLKHLKAEGKHTKSSLLTIEEASFEILKYLDTIWGTLSSSDIFELQQVAFIAADNGKHLVTCGSLFVHLTMNLSPLASKLPSRYLPFLKILEKLGVENMLSISSAMNILSSLQKAGHDYRLNPNELHAVIQLLHFLCNENTKQQISEKCNWELKLVVPDTGCRLVYHNTCVYVDPYGSRYVKFIESSKLRFVHHSVSERLCLAFGIRKLSDVVVEELDHAEHLQTLDAIGYTSLAAIKKKLLNRSFQVAVSSVLKSILSSTSGFKTPDFLALQRSLESVAQRLKFVRCIYTRYWLLPKPLDITLASKESFLPEWKTGPSQQALYYVDRSKTCMLIAEPPSYVSVPDLVALVVSQVLGSPVPLSIGSLFFYPQGSETTLLDILKLSSDERVMDGVGYGSGFLGRDILLGDAKKRQIYPQSPYYQGEIVAWQSQSGEKLKYGRIPEDVRPLAGQALYSINVETFPGKTETIMSSHVFPFQTFSVGKEYPTYVRPGDSMHVEQPVESQRVASKNQKHTIKGLEHGGVPAEEFVQAFKEMLSGARINMDPKWQCLLQTVLSLQEQLKESQAALVLEQEKSESSTKEADSAKVALLCRICLTNEIRITMVPCGHLLCHSCSSAVYSCPICGVQLSTTMKIYLP